MTRKRHTGYEVIPFPRVRRLAIDLGRLARKRHMIHALFEVDVTKARQYLGEHEARTGEALSFTAFLAACIGQAVDRDKSMHACRNWRGQLVLFDEVDILVLFEIEHGGQVFPIGRVIRATNKRTVYDIHKEIRALQVKPLDAREAKAMQVLMRLPGFIRRLLLRIVDKSPLLTKRYRGTVGLTAIGMFANSGGWGIGAPHHTLGVTVGGIARKPGVVEEKIAVRESLSLTLDFDHDIIDGAPAVRFAQQLSDLIEGGYGLQ